MNIIPKVLAEMLCPNESVIPSHKLLKIPSGVILESYGIIRSIPLNPSHEPVADEPPIKGMHQTQEDDEPHPSSFPFEFEEDLFEDFGSASNFPVQVRPLVHSQTEDDGPHNEPFLLEHIKGLSAIMSREWSAEAELSTEVA